MFPLIYNLQSSKNRHFTALLFFSREATELLVLQLSRASENQKLMMWIQQHHQGGDNIISNYKYVDQLILKWSADWLGFVFWFI